MTYFNHVDYVLIRTLTVRVFKLVLNKHLWRLENDLRVETSPSRKKGAKFPFGLSFVCDKILNL